MDKVEKIIVIGASAGGFSALPEVINQLPKNTNAAVFIVLHLSKKAVGQVLVNHLQKKSQLRCKLASNGDQIQNGVVYIAPPDQHMLLKEENILITSGPPENLWRPSIDVLFRSAAAAYGSQVIGIILTGMLDDGASGMSAIKRSGGICLVQDPNEAEFPDMPLSVLDNMQVDHCAHLSEMGYIIKDILSKPRTANPPVPKDVEIESKIAERVAVGLDKVKDLGEIMPYACPTCGGSLFEIHNGNIHRFRCYTGHAFSQEILLHKQAESLEESLWVSIRMMEERKNMLENMGKKDSKKGLMHAAENGQMQVEALKVHIERLKEILLKSVENQK